MDAPATVADGHRLHIQRAFFEPGPGYDPHLPTAEPTTQSAGDFQFALTASVPAQTIIKIKTGETCHLGEYQSFAVEDGTLWASSGHAPKLGKWCVSGLAGQSSTSLRRPFKVSASSRPTCRDAILSAIRPSSPPGA